MTSYHGVSHQELISAINDGLNLLETHSIGPECQKYIDKLRSTKLDAIVSAADDAALKAAIHDCMVNWIFMRSDKVLDFHARNNTDGVGLDIVQRLYKSGMMDGGMSLEHNAFDAESDDWLLIAWARKTKLSGEVLQKLTEIIDELSSYPETSIEVLKEVTLMITDGTSDEDIMQGFKRLGPHGKYVVVQALSQCNGEKMRFDTNMYWFGVVIDNVPEGQVHFKNPVVCEMGDRLHAVMEPFYVTAEVGMSFSGFLVGEIPDMDRSGPVGIRFVSTPRVAQAVANALTDVKVIDVKGDVILPNQVKP